MENKEKPIKADLRTNPDKFKIKPFNPDTHERVLVTFANGTTGYLERKKVDGDDFGNKSQRA